MTARNDDLKTNKIQKYKSKSRKARFNFNDQLSNCIVYNLNFI